MQDGSATMSVRADGLVDQNALTRWMQSQRLTSDAAVTVERMKAGRSNELFLVRDAHRSWVLRRPAGVAWEKAEKGLSREFRLLSVLRETEVPIPQPVAWCGDRSVLGAQFYLMQHVDGFMPAFDIPESFTNTQTQRDRLAFVAMEAIAALHSLDWRQMGLDDFGSPEGFHMRQVERWTRQLSGYQGRELPGLAAMGKWLSGHLPGHWTPTIMHGDYHPLNVLVSHRQPTRLAAILDWETATIGDPFIDVVGYLDVWFDLVGGEQWPDANAMLDHYLSLVPFAPENIDYYRVLYYFRMSVLIEGIYQRSIEDRTRETDESLGKRVEQLIGRARAVIGL